MLTYCINLNPFCIVKYVCNLSSFPDLRCSGVTKIINKKLLYRQEWWVETLKIVCVLCLHPSRWKWKTGKHILSPDKHYEVSTSIVYKKHILLTQLTEGSNTYGIAWIYKCVVPLCAYIHNLNLKLLETMDYLLYLLINGL